MIRGSDSHFLRSSIVLLSLSVTLITGCGNNGEDALEQMRQTSTEDLRETYRVGTLGPTLLDAVDSTKLNPNQKKILDQIKNDSVDFQLVKNELLEKNIRLNGNKYELVSIIQRMDDVLSRTSSFEEQIGFKVDYEKSLEEILGKQIIYDAYYNSVPSLLMQGKMQCLSGAKTFNLLRLHALGFEAFYQEYPVVVFSEGHIQPGFLVQDPLELWHLFTIETTVAGRSIEYRGRTVDLPTGYTVIDLFDYLLVDVFQTVLTSREKVVKVVLERTSKNFHLPEWSRKVQKSGRVSYLREKEAKDIFAFGVPKLVRNQERASARQLPHQMTPDDVRKIPRVEDSKPRTPRVSIDPNILVPSQSNKFCENGGRLRKNPIFLNGRPLSLFSFFQKFDPKEDLDGYIERLTESRNPHLAKFLKFGAPKHLEIAGYHAVGVPGGIFIQDEFWACQSADFSLSSREVKEKESLPWVSSGYFTDSEGEHEIHLFYDPYNRVIKTFQMRR